MTRATAAASTAGRALSANKKTRAAVMPTSLMTRIATMALASAVRGRVPAAKKAANEEMIPRKILLLLCRAPQGLADVVEQSIAEERLLDNGHLRVCGARAQSRAGLADDQNRRSRDKTIAQLADQLAPAHAGHLLVDYE